MQDSLSSLHTQTKKKNTSQALFLLVTDLRVSLFSERCFPLPPANRQLAALLWQRRELPDTLVRAWLVNGRFSTLSLGVWRAANVLEGWLTEKKMIKSFLLLACLDRASPDCFLCRFSRLIDRTTTATKRFIYLLAQLWFTWAFWTSVEDINNMIINAVPIGSEDIQALNYFYKKGKLFELHFF